MKYSNIIKRIQLLEKIYPTDDFDIEDFVKEFISPLEKVLGHTLQISVPNKKYYDKNTLIQDIVKQIPINDLRILAYGNKKEK